MGSLFGQPYNPFQQFFKGKKLRAIMVGLEGAGKTTIIYKINLQDSSQIVPINFGFENVDFLKVKITAWDLQTDCELLAKLYEYYYNDAQGIMFVVDSTDRERIDEAAEGLWKILEVGKLKDAAVLVLANKQDKEGMSIEQITIKLRLQSLKNRKWLINGSCAITGDGLFEGFQWLCKAVSPKK